VTFNGFLRPPNRLHVGEYCLFNDTNIWQCVPVFSILIAISSFPAICAISHFQSSEEISPYPLPWRFVLPSLFSSYSTSQARTALRATAAQPRRGKGGTRNLPGKFFDEASERSTRKAGRKTEGQNVHRWLQNPSLQFYLTLFDSSSKKDTIV